MKHWHFVVRQTLLWLTQHFQFLICVVIYGTPHSRTQAVLYHNCPSTTGVHSKLFSHQISVSDLSSFSSIGVSLAVSLPIIMASTMAISATTGTSCTCSAIWARTWG